MRERMSNPSSPAIDLGSSMTPRLRGQSGGKAKRSFRERAGHKSVSGQAYRCLSNLSTSFCAVDGAAKRVIVQRIASGDMGTRFQRLPIGASAFDMVQLPGRSASGDELTAASMREMPREVFGRIRLIEVKATRGPLKRNLRGLFFSFQYPEQLAAQTLGDHYRIIFVVVNTGRTRSFHREMSWSKMWAMARYTHMQFSVQF